MTAQSERVAAVAGMASATLPRRHSCIARSGRRTPFRRAGSDTIITVTIATQCREGVK
jgi:hypothetical protein